MIFFHHYSSAKYFFIDSTIANPKIIQSFVSGVKGSSSRTMLGDVPTELGGNTKEFLKDIE